MACANFLTGFADDAGAVFTADSWEEVAEAASWGVSNTLNVHKVDLNTYLKNQIHDFQPISPYSIWPTTYYKNKSKLSISMLNISATWEWESTGYCKGLAK